MVEDVEWHDSTIVRPGPLSSLHPMLIPSSQVYFEMASGSRITNLVSYNEAGELLLTFSFANGLPPPGLGPDGEPLPVEKLNEALGGGIESTLRVIREMLADGRVV